MALETSQTINKRTFTLQPALKDIYCRLCLLDPVTGKYRQLFSPFNDFKTVAQTVMDLTQIEILESDQHSKLICVHCFDKLTITEDFKALVTKSDYTLKQQFSTKDPLEINKSDCSAIVQEDDIEIKKEITIVDHESNDGTASKVENVIQQNSSLKGRQIKCPKCGKVFQNYQFRREHYETGCAPLLNYKCKVCNKGFTKKLECTTHELTHADIKMYQCKKCGKDFKSATHLARHLDEHLKSKSLNCKICNDPTKCTHKSLYECETCHRQYDTHKRYRHHLQVHNRKFKKCELCGLSVANLTWHIKRHTKPYKCNVCQQSFGTNTILKNHMSIHSDEQPYTCEFCQKSFKHPSSFKTHVSNHINKNRFKCDLCTATFQYHSVLTQHVNRVHNFVKFN